MGKTIGELQIQKQPSEISVNQQLQEQTTVMAAPMQQQQKSHLEKEKPVKTRSRSVFQKASKKDIYAVDPSQVRENFSDHRVDAFQEILQSNTEYDSQLFQKQKGETEAAAGYRKMMKAIEKYANLSPMKTKSSTQAGALRSAQKAIAEYQEKYAGQLEKADEVAARYKLYFETFTGGMLNERKQLASPHLTIDATQKQPQLLERTHRYVSRRDDALFPHEPSVNDVEQMGLGDCYLQAAAATLVLNNPEKLKEGMQDNGDGTVTVRFFKKRVDLTEEEKQKFLSAELIGLWDKEDYSSMTDTELAFKILQHGGEKAIWSEAEKAIKEQADSEIARIRQEREAALGAEMSQDEIQKLSGYVRSTRQAAGLMLVSSRDKSKGGETLALAKFLAENETVKNQVLENMRRQFSQPDADKTLIMQQAVFSIAQLLPRKKMGDFEDGPDSGRIDAEAFKDAKNQTAREDPNELIPLYVTVTKDVPVNVLGLDAYTNNCLWMQMLEKAYAASGLHSSKVKKVKSKYEKQRAEIEQNEEGLSQEEVKKRLEEVAQKEKEELEVVQHSYKNIEGGYSGHFLESFTGEKLDKQEWEKHTPDKALEVIEEMKDSFSQEEIFDWIGIAIPSSSIIKDLKKYLTDKFGTECETKKGDTQKNKIYFSRPIYIEDIAEAFNSMETWLSEETRAYVDNFLDMAKEVKKVDPKTITINALGDIMRQSLQKESKRFEISHRPMSTEYTDFAERQYEKIKDRLEKGISISVGTRRFLPKGMKASGRNGESEQGGLVENHAYSIIGTKDMDGCHFVMLRNPWADGVLQYTKVTQPDGTVSYTSRKIYTDTRGIFYMELNDFLSKMAHMDFNGTVRAQPAQQKQVPSAQAQEKKNETDHPAAAPENPNAGGEVVAE